MTVARFWSIIESCRSAATSMVLFNNALERAAEKLTLRELAGLYQRIRDDIDSNAEELAYLLNERIEVGFGGDMWDRYGGWLIAQGREFRELVARDPAAALSRIPTVDECVQGESVPFIPIRVCYTLTGQVFFELFGDHLEHVAAVSDDLADRETLLSLHAFLDREFGRSMVIRHINRFEDEFTAFIGVSKMDLAVTLDRRIGKWVVTDRNNLHS